MVYFYKLYHRNCALRYVGWVLELRKLSFRGLKCQIDAKKAYFRELMGKIGHLRPIWAFKPNLCPIFMEYSIGNVT